MRTRSDWRAECFDSERKIVWIVDENLGNISVTNDSEAVVKAVLEIYPGYRIIYRDTIGTWSELCHHNGQFIGFRFTQEPPHAEV